jgi:hypothetical protein
MHGTRSVGAIALPLLLLLQPPLTPLLQSDRIPTAKPTLLTLASYF